MVRIEELESAFEKNKISRKYIEIFKEHGIEEIEQLFLLGVENIRAITGCSKELAQEILDIAKPVFAKNLPAPIESSRIKIEEKYVETPIEKLNVVLGGGFRVGTLIELCGSFASGKTQFLFTQAVLEASKGNYVLFIDTEKTFSPDRIREIIVNRFGVEKVNEIMDRILVLNALSLTELLATILFLTRTLPNLNKEGKNVTLICIDSLINPFRAEYGSEGLAKLAERQQHLNWTLRQLLRIASVYKCVVLFTNQIVASIGSPQGFVPSGGNIVAHASTIRIMLIKSGSNKRILRIFDAPNIPQIEIEFKITEKGVEEYKKD